MSDKYHDSEDWDNMEWDEETGEFVSVKKTDDTEPLVHAKDSNGVVLENGDTVILTRDLDVKGVAISMKRGDKLKKIRCGDDAELIECKIGKKGVFIKTCFVKKI